MNITFMIGNGFDIGLGMRTSFKDFFDIYCAKALKKEEYTANKYDQYKDNANVIDYSNNESTQEE